MAVPLGAMPYEDFMAMAANLARNYVENIPPMGRNALGLPTADEQAHRYRMAAMLGQLGGTQGHMDHIARMLNAPGMPTAGSAVTPQVRQAQQAFARAMSQAGMMGLDDAMSFASPYMGTPVAREALRDFAWQTGILGDYGLGVSPVTREVGLLPEMRRILTELGMAAPSVVDEDVTPLGSLFGGLEEARISHPEQVDSLSEQEAKSLLKRILSGGR